MKRCQCTVSKYNRKTMNLFGAVTLNSFNSLFTCAITQDLTIQHEIIYKMRKVWFPAWKQRCRDTKPAHERSKPSSVQLMTSAYQDQVNAGFSKVCEIFKVLGIRSLKYVRESVIVARFPRPETWRWTKRTVIGCLTCQSNGLMGGA